MGKNLTGNMVDFKLIKTDYTAIALIRNPLAGILQSVPRAIVLTRLYRNHGFGFPLILVMAPLQLTTNSNQEYYICIKY